MMMTIWRMSSMISFKLIHKFTWRKFNNILLILNIEYYFKTFPLGLDYSIMDMLSFNFVLSVPFEVLFKINKIIILKFFNNFKF